MLAKWQHDVTAATASRSPITLVFHRAMKSTHFSGLLASLLISSHALAQNPEHARTPASRNQPIRVALVASEATLGGLHVRVLRRNNQKPHDVILVDAFATSRDLASAIQLLGSLRAQLGDSLPHDLRASPTSAVPPSDWTGSPYQL